MIFVLKRFSRLLATSALVALASFGLAQFPLNKTALISNITVATFGSTGGNDCWGYVSPSGREYAIMGLRNSVAFVEVTNPAAPNIIATFPHTSSTWGDIKVFGHFAYAVTEAIGTGIQVFDMSQIDGDIVTLVRTITSPGRTHNLALDTVNGYLYTCGSRDGTGTTMCFDLSTPSNPVRVGANSMTLDYQHDGTIRTFTSGPYAGRQIWYGFSEGRGVDLYDLTDKSLPIKIKTIAYPGTKYCHQGWLSADAKYLYVDDELDEGSGGQATTRTLVFNVEDLVSASYVGSFTSGVAANDHNQYWADGFIFQANYRSGLRIFDAENPTAPEQVGFFDTYPTNNNAGFDGAWSNYPYFPSGNILVSDINRGMFMIDATEATTREVVATDMSVLAGKNLVDGLSLIESSDDVRLVVQPANFTRGHDAISLKFSTETYDASPLKVRVVVESSSTERGLEQTLEVFNRANGQWEFIDRRTITSIDTAITVSLGGNLTRFVDPVTRTIEARLRYRNRNGREVSGSVFIDAAYFRVTR